ncbi:MAG: hypothetical protein ACOC71_00880 [Hyphomicrobiales bacterium]
MTAPDSSDGFEIPHLAGPAAAVRQVVAAHFVSDCRHIVEIGGHLRPVTHFLTHAPDSVVVVDPKVEPYEAEDLNGRPCRVRHIPRKFQDVVFEAPDRQYGLVLLGYSLKPYGDRQPLGEALFRLIDNARTVVLEYPPALERAASQVPHILARPTLKERCTIEFVLDDSQIRGSPFARRRLVVLDPAQEAA